MNSIKIALIAGAFALVAGTANAATCFGTDRSITVDPSDACYASGNGNIGSAVDTLPGLVEIADTGDGATSYLTGDTNSGLSGEITVTGDFSAYSLLVLALKVGGNPSINIGWGAFEIDGSGVYSWSTEGQNALSHTVLYGQLAPVPLPASALLLLAGLGGLVAMRRRAKV